jgi:hypothetical protein
LGKLAERLGDPARAGVYRVETAAAVEEAAALNGYALLHFALDTESGMKAFERFAVESNAGDRVALAAGFERRFLDESVRCDALLAALDVAAVNWRARGARVFAVFLDPMRVMPALAPLYNWNKSRTPPN